MSRAYTLTELIVTVAVIGVVSAVVVPVAVTTAGGPGLKAAANVLAADIEYAESYSISHPNTPALIKFDLVNNRYWVATQATPAVPLTHPADGQPYVNDFRSGRTARMGGVSVISVGTADGASLPFDAYGRPIGQNANVPLRLANGSRSMTLTVDRITGEVTIASP